LKTALAFSGGMDSLACLYLYRNRLHEIFVLWVNTGKAYPETIEIINQAREICPNFIEIKTDQAVQNAEHGLPTDLVNVENTALGFSVSGKKQIMIQSGIECCYWNIMKPLNDMVATLGITHLIRGQRLEEDYKSSARDGDVVDGVTYIQPIEKWSRNDVLKYLGQNIEIPEHFYLDHTSLDCYDCTAYLRHTADRFQWASKKHPDLHKINMERLNSVKETIQPVYEILGAING
jgi:3'-phosphoadenosine 5'-phosphosulfate sulfotransferase (PAPS reductase)/FAD synthetase